MAVAPRRAAPPEASSSKAGWTQPAFEAAVPTDASSAPRLIAHRQPGPGIIPGAVARTIGGTERLMTGGAACVAMILAARRGLPLYGSTGLIDFRVVRVRWGMAPIARPGSEATGRPRV